MDITKIGGHIPNTMATKTPSKGNNVQENKTTLQVKRDSKGNGVEVSISNEGRVRQSSGQSKLTVDNSILDGLNIGDFKAALNSSGVAWDNFTEFTDPSLVVNRSAGLVIRSDDSQQEKYRKELLNATSLYGNVGNELDSVGKFSSVASKYMEMRKGIEEKYSGEELENNIKWLDESYDNAINTMAEHATFGVKSAAKLYEFKAKVNNGLVEHAKTHGHTFGIPVKDKVEYDKDTFDKSMKTLSQNITNSIKHYGALAKQYMLDGNAAPVTEEDKNKFSAYLSQNADSSKGIYSTDDLKTLDTVFAPRYSNTTDALYTALEKLEGCGLSNDIKAAITRTSTHGDRMFSTVPKGFEEREQALYEEMLKWQQTSNS